MDQGSPAPARRVVTALLLLFVGLSVGWALLGPTGGPTDPPVPPSEAPAPDPGRTDPPHTGPRVVAYYFHGDRRCDTCESIERQAREALTGSFADAIAAGALEFRLVNTDRPENAHFVEEFELAFGTLLLAEQTEGKDGRTGRWRNLSRVWEVVGDEDAYRAYVTAAVREALEGRW